MVNKEVMGDALTQWKTCFNYSALSLDIPPFDTALAYLGLISMCGTATF